jgi:hypothetical protein
VELFDTDGQYDVTRDGQRFLFVEPLEEDKSAPMIVVLNWQAGLER